MFDYLYFVLRVCVESTGEGDMPHYRWQIFLKHMLFRSLSEILSDVSVVAKFMLRMAL